MNPAEQSTGNISAALDSLRDQLIDLGSRNRLIHTPIKGRSTRQLAITDELPDEIFKLLAAGKAMTFDPARQNAAAEPEDDDDPVLLPAEHVGEESTALAARHTDTRLQTSITPEALQRCLLNIFREARSLEEEQGVSVLFLALGFLRWYESPSSDTERFAPLLLYPVDLLRDKVRGRLRLKARDDELEVNLSLKSRLMNDFGLLLPELPEDTEWLPSTYFSAVQEAVSSRPRWQVQADIMQLGFFSFAKFRMWEDLADSAEWPEGSGPQNSALLHNLLAQGFSHGGAVTGDGENLDRKFPDLRALGHILDADASQAQVIAAAAEGKSLVVQGPPGTGKSQTIANIIALAAREGKRVLFISEKRAALEVVHDRLEHAGLGSLCLELHSHKANRKQVYQDLKSTLELAPPTPVDESKFERATETRDELNRISSLIHARDPQTDQTPYLVMGKRAELAERNVQDPGFQIEGADQWSASEFDQRVHAISNLVAMTHRHGIESAHPWRGTTRRLDSIESNALETELRAALECLDRLKSLCKSARELTDISPESAISELRVALERLTALSRMPAQVPELLGKSALLEAPGQVLLLCERIRDLQALQRNLEGVVVNSAFELRWEEHLLAVREHGNSLFRFLKGAYRKATARLKAVCRDKPAGDQKERIALLEQLVEQRTLTRLVESGDALGRAAFGSGWSRSDTEVEPMLDAVRWLAEQLQGLNHPCELRDRVECWSQRADRETLHKDFESCLDEWNSCWQQLNARLGLDVPAAFAHETLECVPLEEVLARVDSWCSNRALSGGWHQLAGAAREASHLGLDTLRRHLASGKLAAEQAETALVFIRAEALWKRFRAETPEIESISGESRSALVQRFRELDHKLLELSAHVVAEQHTQGLPTGSSGQIGIVRGEANKKARHMKIRQLLKVAGDAVALVKPIFLMSPMSVAQYLDPAGLRFDLLLIDEASQVKPADAMGAICRANQIVVVGDQQQMPPSSFFDRQTSNSNEDDDLASDADALAASQIGDMESILSLCDARGMPGGTLRWHYRSRHESLIAVSNEEFYQGRLICPPSPQQRSTDMGFSFTRVDGYFERGKGRNPIEAEAVCEAVLAHVRERPGETLGVVAMSVAQRDTIQNKLELMRADHPELDAFCSESREGAFFVKNLENVQGDEREAIFVSIGYGRDSDGFISNNFGPVSREGGERRLNVLFTRAKLRCRIFSSMLHSDIRIEATRSQGARVLKRFLKYAETGDLDLPTSTGRAMDSPFEEAVALALHKHGHKVSPQVGSKGFRIDLAVHDPDCEGNYLLAVECDGARYHSSSWARERDRLRQTVLEGTGWRFHRIWSTDWFYNRDVELQKLLAAIDRARRTKTPAAAPKPPPRQQPERRAIAAGGDEKREDICLYEEAEFTPRRSESTQLHETPIRELCEQVTRIVTVEGPVHISEVARRLTQLWGLQRTGSRIRAHVERAVQLSIKEGVLRWDAGGVNRFVTTGDAPSRTPSHRPSRQKVRNRKDAGASLRKPDMLPPSEVRAAILTALEENVGLHTGTNEVAKEVVRQFGLGAVSRGLKAVVAAEVDALLDSDVVVKRNGQLRIEK